MAIEGTILVLTILFIVTIGIYCRIAPKTPAPRVYTPVTPQALRQVLLPMQLPPGKWKTTSINRMARLLSRIATGFDTCNMRKRYQNDWKLGHGSSDAEIISLIQVLGETSFPRDYFAFLKLNNMSSFFTYENGPLLQFNNAEGVRWDENGLETRTFVECLIGRTALNAIISEIECIESLMLPLRVLHIEIFDRVCLIGPKDCRRIAEFWEPLLAHMIVSDDVKKEASRYSNEHFGCISPFVMMKSQKSWIVVENNVRKTGTRIYPSFSHYLEELAKMEELQADMRGIRHIETRIAASDRRMWKTHPYDRNWITTS
ncbi:hypothetical protein F4813DRAFT_399590 [Daldinia decipiens]|uniref:uncharacterized protein n=1 Tax=Daldinia decipiens TaxID=326647 RepID=UPI0020C2A781|nr:uncharacterized protein F4813DRAFT_399590 [Daldinia decipiens]KAI1653914.1 hypothetical protein F4813DRAFT_399590 [Daldinia decipiens]